MRPFDEIGIVDGRLKLGRRAFIGGLSAALLASSARARAGAARVTVDFEGAGQPLAPDFIGLSYESAILSPGSYFAPENATLIALMNGETVVA